MFDKWKDFWKQPAWKPKKLSQMVMRATIKSSHRSIEEAILADIIDVIPIVGDVGNAMRVVDAAKKGESTPLALQTGDMIVGIIPIVGFIPDLVTPTNTAIYVLRSKKYKEKIKNKLGKDYV